MQECMFGQQYLDDRRDRRALYVKYYKDSYIGDLITRIGMIEVLNCRCDWIIRALTPQHSVRRWTIDERHESLSLCILSIIQLVCISICLPKASSLLYTLAAMRLCLTKVPYTMKLSENILKLSQTVKEIKISYFEYFSQIFEQKSWTNDLYNLCVRKKMKRSLTITLTKKAFINLYTQGQFH